MYMPKSSKIARLSLVLLLGACAPITPKNSVTKVASSLEIAPEGQLPQTATPLEYHLELAIIPQQKEFSGKVDIKVHLNDAANHLWLHGKKIKVSKSSATLADGSKVAVTYSQQTDSGVAKVEFNQTLTPQNLTLHLEYTAAFNTELEGLYRVKSDNEWYAFTQFEPIAGRLAFPSFDEPRFKTPFTIALIIDENHVASAPYSAISEKSLGNGQKRIEYKTTDLLPTYLIAFAVGPMDVVTYEPIAANNYRNTPVPLRGFAPKGKGKLLDYALKNTGPLLELIETYFEMPYPYEKIDIIAVPDFSAGAMENVGVITFRDWLLLIDEKTAPARQFRSYAYVMVHELAHQWFGNLVTMPWWDDLWLNEAFASWMESLIVRDFEPSYKAELSTVQTSLYAMRTDSKVSARQIRQPITNEHDIHNAFDGITYSKGEGVLGMFENFVGENDFQKGLQHHMKKFAHGNATANDFLESLAQSTGHNITSSFETFLLQPGVPFLNVDIECRSNKAALIHIEQSRYFPVGTTGDSNQTWEIPYCSRYKIGTETHSECHLLNSVPKQSIELKQEGCPKWYTPNANGAGYYRWNLSQPQWTQLQENLDSLKTTEILSLTDSLKAAALTGALDATTILKAAPLYVNSEERRVAETPMGTLTFVRNYILEDSLIPNLESLSQNLYKKQVQRLDALAANKKSLSDEDKLLRQSILSFLASTAKSPQVRKQLSKWGEMYLGIGNAKKLAPEAIDSNLASTALRIAIEEGPIATLQTAISHLQQATDPMIRSQLLSGIAAANTPQKSELVLKLMLSDSLRSSERGRLLGNHMRVRENTQAVWAWVQANYKKVVKILPSMHLGYFPYIASGFCSVEKKTEVQAFFADKVKDFPGGPRNLQSVTESIALCAARKKAMSVAMSDYFATPMAAAR